MERRLQPSERAVPSHSVPVRLLRETVAYAEVGREDTRARVRDGSVRTLRERRRRTDVRVVRDERARTPSSQSCGRSLRSHIAAVPEGDAEARSEILSWRILHDHGGERLAGERVRTVREPERQAARPRVDNARRDREGRDAFVRAGAGTQRKVGPRASAPPRPISDL